MKYIFCAILTLLLISCGDKAPSNSPSGDNDITDLPFSTVETPKGYADLILRALKTNRKQPIYDQMDNRDDINVLDFNRYISMYSTAITGRKDWEFRDIYDENVKKDDKNGFDYAWLDPKGRLGLQINILPVKTESGYKVKVIEMRSRLDIMESIAIPGGPIEEYKKLNYNWEKPIEEK